MDLIDGIGRLFGFINIIDGLAVLLEMAVVLASVALVTQSEPESKSSQPSQVTIR